MNTATFLQTLEEPAPFAGLPPALEALWWAHKQDWQHAHRCVASASGADAARVHAYLHRWEGDLDNAGYWYRRAGQEMSSAPLDEEWRSLVGALTRSP